MSTITSGKMHVILIRLSWKVVIQTNRSNITCCLPLLDIDECALPDKGGCEDKCKNYEGGYYCTCPAGYRLMDDDKHCEGTPLALVKYKKMILNLNVEARLAQ